MTTPKIETLVVRIVDRHTRELIESHETQHEAGPDFWAAESDALTNYRSWGYILSDRNVSGQGSTLTFLR